MSLTHPLGLLALAGIPAVLILFFLSPKYQETSVASTYIWQLSRQYLQKHRLSQKLIRYMILACQIMTIAIIALILSGPQLECAAQSADLVVLLDASASMLQRDAEGVSRFEAAKQSIASQIKRLGASAHVSVITTDSAAHLIVQHAAAHEALRMVEGLSCGYGTADWDSALRQAQELLDTWPGAEICLYTDHDLSDAEPLQVINVSQGREEWNAALSGLTATYSPSGASVSHQAISYGRDAELTLALYVNGKLTSAQVVFCPQNEPVTVTWQVTGVNVDQLRVWTDADDGLAMDNECCLFRQPSEAIAIQLVTGHAYYWETLFAAFPQVTLTCVSTLENAVFSGYDLYLYDGCTPERLPQDGAVMLVGTEETPEELELACGEVIRGTYLSLPKRFVNSANRPLVTGVTANRIAVQRFRELTANSRYTPILLCGELPAVLAGKRENGTMCIVFAFSLHESNLPMLPDFVTLMEHLLNAVMPDMMEKFHYTVGETIEVTAVPFCVDMLLQQGSGELQPVAFTQDTASFSVDAPGIYRLWQNRAVGERKYCRFFVHLPEEESDIRIGQLTMRLSLLTDHDAQAGSDTEDGMDLTAYLAVLLCLLLIAEWVVYHHERA